MVQSKKDVSHSDVNFAVSRCPNVPLAMQHSGFCTMLPSHAKGPLSKLLAGTCGSPAFFVSVVQPSLFLAPVVFLSTGHGKFCGCLSYAVSAVPQPPRKAGVLVGPFFRKLETFPPCHETLRRGVKDVR